MTDYYDSYNVTRIVYDLIKYDRNFRSMWDRIIADRLLTDLPVDRDTAVTILNSIRPIVQNSQPALDSLNEYIDTINRRTEEIDPLLPILIARKHYHRPLLSRSYDDIWQYYYPDTVEKLDSLKLPYDNFPVLATEQSKEYVSILEEDQTLYVARLQKYAEEVQKRYSVDELIEVCTKVNSIAEQMLSNGLNIGHNSNVHKLMIALHIIARNSVESPYTVISNSTVLSQSTYESNVYLTTIDTTARGLSMITKTNKSGELYGPLYEYIVGTFLNRYIPEVPGFMYSYGYYDGLPPSLIGNVAPLLGYKNNANALVKKQFYEGFFQYLTNSVTLDDFIMTASYEVQLNNTVLSHVHSVLLVYLILMNNVAYMNELTGFVHGDLHLGNVLVTVLPTQYYITLRIYTDQGFRDIPVLTNVYVYCIDYGFASIKTGSDTRIYSKQMPIPIPHYSTDSTQDIHSALSLLLLRMHNGLDFNVFSLEHIRFVYRIYSMLFTGSYIIKDYTLNHYNTVISILSRGQKYSMPQDTVYTMRTLNRYNTLVMQELGIPVNSTGTNILFNGDTVLNDSTSADLPTLYLTNASRYILSSYYTSIDQTIAANNRLNERLNDFRITDSSWTDLSTYIRDTYGQSVESAKSSFISNNMHLVSALRSKKTASTLFNLMHSYAYNLRIRTILLAMSKYYSINPALITDVESRLSARSAGIREILDPIFSDYNRLHPILETVTHSNLLQYAYGTYNGYLIDNLDTVDE